MDFSLDGITIHLEANESGHRLETKIESWRFSEPMESIKEAIGKNYWSVKEYFKNKSTPVITAWDLNNLSLRITLLLYQMKRNHVTKVDGIPVFNNSDIECSDTRESLVNFFRKFYPDSYSEKCMTLLGWTRADLDGYVEGRDQLYNK